MKYYLLIIKKWLFNKKMKYLLNYLKSVKLETPKCLSFPFPKIGNPKMFSLLASSLSLYLSRSHHSLSLSLQPWRLPPHRHHCRLVPPPPLPIAHETTTTTADYISDLGNSWFLFQFPFATFKVDRSPINLDPNRFQNKNL